MAKEITFEYEGATYTLAFTRKTVEILTRAGFNPDMITEQPILGMPMLFQGAFMVHHKNMNVALKEQIWKDIDNKKELIGELLNMYAEPINALLADPEEASEKKVKWEAH